MHVGDHGMVAACLMFAGRYAGSDAHAWLVLCLRFVCVRLLAVCLVILLQKGKTSKEAKANTRQANQPMQQQQGQPHNGLHMNPVVQHLKSAA